MSAAHDDWGARHRQNDPYALSDATYVLLRDLIRDRTGVLFDDTKRAAMAEKLAELVAHNGLTSFLDYYYLLRYDDAAPRHWAELLDRLAVPETYFWRQAEQLLALANVLVPTHFATNADRPFRIWSAACCTGEEPVSIAIALAEAGLLQRYPIRITGTDGSPALIERARRGLYTERSFRQIPPHFRATYFEAVGNAWKPVDFIRRAIQWDVANLVEPAEIRAHAAAEAILCRNVFIYFDDAAIRRVVQSFAERMPHDGYLFVGAAESLTRLGVDLELAEIGGAFAYVKEGRREVVERNRAATPATLAARTATP